MNPPFSGPKGTLIQKVRFVYLPFLVWSALCICGYTGLNWLGFDGNGWFALDEEVVQFWLPAALTFAVVGAFIRPRIAALRFGRWSHGTEAFCLLAGGAIAVPMIIAQIWLSETAGGMTRVESSNAIASAPSTKFYTIATVSVDEGHTSRYTRSSYEGRHSETLRIACYFICPFSRLSSAEPVWLGTVYDESISSRLTDDERGAAIQSFMADASRRFEAEDLTRATYFSRAPKNQDLRGFQAALERNPLHSKGATATVLLRHAEDFASRGGSKLGWTVGSFGIGAGLWFVMLLFVPMDARVAKKPKKLGLKNPLADACRFLWPHRGYAATPIIIDINLLVFLGMVLAGFGVTSVSARDLFAVGGNYRPALVDGQLWRLLTSLFIHAGIIHLANNVISLLLAGLFLEQAMGSLWFAVCFIVCGIGGGLASAGYHPATVAVGASGGIFGLWGVLLALGITGSKHGAVPFKRVLPVAAVIIGINLILGLASVGIDNAAHLGGLAAGLIFGVMARLFPKVLLNGTTAAKKAGTGLEQAEVSNTR